MSTMMNSNECIQVFIRCRPLLESEKHLPTPIEIYAEVNKIIAVGGNKSAVKTFSFDKVFAPEAEQAVVYNNVVAPLIQEVLMGFNCTILAYGQTGTGKTFTMEGIKCSKLEDDMEHSMAGIIPRSMKHVFQELTYQKSDFEVSVSFLELYNEEIYDLLSKSDDLVKLKLYDSASPKGSVIIQGLEVRTVKCMQDLNDILDQGYKKRRKAATFLNKMSSRSHTVFTVTVSMKEKYTTMEKTKTGKLNLVDLAGSENIGRSGAIERRAREAGNINQSLLALGRVITALCENAIHVPYRESKLTRLLRDSLGGQTKTAVIATISPSAFHLDETLNTLEYALRAKNITNKPEINSQVSATALTKDYLEKIYLLKEQIQEASALKSFQVDPDNLKYLETSVEASTNEEYKELELQEELIKESQESDEAILKAKETLNLKEAEWKKIISDQEELSLILEKEQEEVRFEEVMLSILNPVLSKMHDKQHKALKEEDDIANEVKKLEKKAAESFDENRRLEKQFSTIKRSQSNFNESLMKFQDQLCNNIMAVHMNVINENEDCKIHLSSMIHNYDSFMASSQKFSELKYIVDDLEKIKNDFRETLLNALQEEQNKIHEHQSELENVGSFGVCSFDSLQPLLNKCEENLNSILSSLKYWKREVIKKVTDRDEFLDNYLLKQEENYKSFIQSWEEVVNKQHEHLHACDEILAAVLSQEDRSKKQWENQLNAVENAVKSLKMLFTENMTSDIEQNTSITNILQELADDEINNVKLLSEFCETSTRVTEEFKNEMVIPSEENLCNKLDDMKESTKNALKEYEDLLSNFTSCINQSKISDELWKGMEQGDVEDKERRKQLPAMTSCIQSFKEKLSSKEKSCSSIYSDYQADLTTIEKNQAVVFKEFQDSFNQLHNIFSRSVSDHINTLETGISEEKFNIDLIPENCETSCEESSLLDSTFTLLEGEGTEEGNVCLLCKNKEEDTIFIQEENGVSTNNATSRIKLSNSKASKWGKNRKEISQTDLIEKWCQDLLSSNWEDQPSSESEKSHTTV